MAKCTRAPHLRTTVRSHPRDMPQPFPTAPRVHGVRTAPRCCEARCEDHAQQGQERAGNPQGRVHGAWPASNKQDSVSAHGFVGAWLRPVRRPVPGSPYAGAPLPITRVRGPVGTIILLLKL